MYLQTENIESVTSNIRKKAVEEFKAKIQDCDLKLRTSLEEHNGCWKLFDVTQDCYLTLDNFMAKYRFVNDTRGSKNSCGLLKELGDLYRQINDVWLHETNLVSAIEGICTKNLSAERKIALTKQLKAFKREGSHLSDSKRQEAMQVLSEIDDLSLKFQQNVISSLHSRAFYIQAQDVKDISCLQSYVVKDRLLVNSEVGSLILQHSPKSSLRRQVKEKFSGIASEENFDNSVLIPKIVQLCKRHAYLIEDKLTYAEQKLELDNIPSYSEAVAKLEKHLEQKKPNALKFLQILEKHYGQELFHWDINYVDFQYRKILSGNSDVLNKFTWKSLLQGLPILLQKMFGCEATVSTMPYERFKISLSSKEFNGDIIVDPFVRSGRKYQGAVMFPYHTSITGKQTAAIACNFVNPKIKPELTLEEVQTFLHEMGHALHNIMSNVGEYNIRGINVNSTWVEVPSQFLEFVMSSKLVMHLGDNISEEDYLELQEITKHGALLNDFQMYVVSYLALIDLEIYHQDVTNYEDIVSIYDKHYQVHRLMHNTESPNLLTHFSHIFGGGYSARYYTYVFSRMLANHIWTHHNKEIIQDLYTSGDTYMLRNSLCDLLSRLN